MVFADASVLVAVLKREPDAEAQMVRLLDRVGEAWVSPIVRYEVVTSLARDAARRLGRMHLDRRDVEAAIGLLDDLLADLRSRETAITPEIGRLALDAATRYGKVAGHPARLNIGDCFAHACATSLGAPLLYKGDDFARTDLARTDPA